MPVIKEYLESLERLLNEIPFKLSTKLQVENRGDVALYIKGEILFIDGSELHFKEYLIAIPVLKKSAYSYHYQSKNKELIFRYDNAEHHYEVITYPHHKHLKDNRVLPSKEVSMKEVIKGILNTLADKGKRGEQNSA